MNLVFAVTGKYKQEYERLVELMKSNAQVASLLEDSSNILTVIEQQYEVTRIYSKCFAFIPTSLIWTKNMLKSDGYYQIFVFICNSMLLCANVF